MTDNSVNNRHPSTSADPSSLPSSATTLLIDAQVAFIQQWWLSSYQTSHQTSLFEAFWRWLSTQPLSRYLTDDALIRLINDWLLAQPLTESLRADIRTLLYTLIYHPINDSAPFSTLVQSSQVSEMAAFIASHEAQRSMLIHSLIGNDTFADLLTQTLHHAINDFMEGTLDKAGGVGKLMKFGRSSFEKATNNNLDDRLQAYLHRNIKELTRRAEDNARNHLSNDEVQRLIESGWARIKDHPISTLQRYLDSSPYLEKEQANLNNDPSSNLKNNNTTLNQLEAEINQSYDQLRLSPYVHTLVSAAVQTWYARHADAPIAELLAGYHLDTESLLTSQSTPLAPLFASLSILFDDLVQSDWLGSQLRQMLMAFYDQPEIQSHLKGYPFT